MADTKECGRTSVGRRAQRGVGHPVSFTRRVWHTQALTGQSRPTTDTTATTPALCGAGPDRMSDSPGAVQDRVADTSDTCPRAFADVPATLTSDGKRLADAVDIVRTHGHLSGSDMARRHVRAHRPAVARPRRGTPTAAPDSGPCRLSDKAGHPTAHGTSRDPRCAVGRHREGMASSIDRRNTRSDLRCCGCRRRRN